MTKFVLKDLPELQGTKILDGAVVEMDTTKRYVFLFSREMPMADLEYAAQSLSKLLGPGRGAIMIDDGVRILELVPAEGE